MRTLTPSPRAAVGGLVAALVVLGSALPSVAPAYADVGACESIAQPNTTSDPDHSASAPMVSMGIAQFQAAIRDQHIVPGQGIGVAVVDSGVVASPGLPVIDPRIRVGTAKSAPAFYHGSAVAGLIAGATTDQKKPIGIAPGARLLDVHFYDVDSANTTTEVTAEEGAKLTQDTLAAALDEVAQVASSERIRIVNVSAAVPSSPALKAAVSALTSRGVVVVASAGNRPTDGEYPSSFASAQYGEDAADAIYPAGYAVDDPLVVAVGSTVGGEAAADPQSKVLANSAIDVAAPSAGGVSYAINGVTCGLGDEPATSWAAAEVSGVLAALMSVFTDESPREVVSRLEATATGQPPTGSVPTDRFTGQGVIQPLEALTRPLAFTADGSVKADALPGDDVIPATLPEPAPDVLRSTRHHALWWGLSGGGALLIAVMLRPVLARRRRTA